MPICCELCGREVETTTIHHLVPRTTHKQVSKKTGIAKTELAARTADLCVPCHKTIHRHISEKELAASYDTIEKLLTHPTIADFVYWVQRQPDRPITIR